MAWIPSLFFEDTGVGDSIGPMVVLVDATHLPCTVVVEFCQALDVGFANCPGFTAPEEDTDRNGCIDL